MTDPRHDAAHAVRALRAQLDHLQELVDHSLDAPDGPAAAGPDRSTALGEERWPVAVAVVVAVVLQLALAERYSLGPRWLLPVIETAVLIGVVAANPRRVNRRSQALRLASVVLVAFITFANGWSTSELIRGIIAGGSHIDATSLLGNGSAIYLTNIIAFALWYWEGDGGGPVARALHLGAYPAFLFPQMTQRGIAPPDWQPSFVDYLYTSYTNATAFSPTDTMPLLRWSKLLMLLQSAVALVTVGLVVARAVNIL